MEANKNFSHQSLLAPIGIFDSGLGGLSVLNEIRRYIPKEEIIYFADSAWCPYGTKKPEKIKERVFRITDFLLEKKCKLIVAACNSATITAIEALRENYPLPFVGMEPGIKPAVQQSKTGVIGVLATEASLAGEKFLRLVDTHNQNIKIITRPCPRFVELVENGDLESENALRIVREETMPLIDAGSDVLVLGCTHYPFLRPLLEKVIKKEILVLDTGVAVASQTQRVLEKAKLLNTSQKPSTKRVTIYSTGDFKKLSKLLPSLCSEIDTKCYPIDIRS